MLIGLSTIWSISSKNSFDRFVTNFLFLLLIVPVSSLRFDKKHIMLMKKCLVISSRLTLILALMFASFDYGRLHFSGILSEDPNYLCCYFVFGIANIFQSFISGSKKKYWPLYFFELLAYFYVVLFTGSRGGSIAVLACIIVVSLFSIKPNNPPSLIRSAFVLILGLLLLYLVYFIMPSNITDRFSIQSFLESDGTGRYLIWDSGLSVFNSSSFLRKMLGYGAGTVRDMFVLYGYRDIVMHNIFLEVLCENGLVGLIIYCLMIVQYFVASLKKRSAFAMSVLSAMVVLSLSTSLYSFKPYWNIMLFIITMSNCNPNPSRVKVVL